ncbi:MAG: pyridoxal 5'-phosphate synthase glutaminase subunit PdxT [Aigarchaeota archaeon]|nr:pyridoxal 5'-phosphate synthase glutaminase subunit PdxT [Aigarchaeota archaeon]MDW8092910.1 pyridoxal 5'-phosphate synthase glutaminase subunit PdxT [Nitrososphaerota archaeon]
MIIGVTGFQGDVEEHVKASRIAGERIGVDCRVIVVKDRSDLKDVDGLIIPGGESTVMGKLAVYRDVMSEIKERIESGLPVMGTCAGLILLAKRVYDRVVGETRQPLIGTLDITVERNTYGRQRESFESWIEVRRLSIDRFRAVFIRAPAIVEVGGDVEVLATLGTRPVAVLEGGTIGTSFHPELTSDTKFHELLLNIAKGRPEGCF